MPDPQNASDVPSNDHNGVVGGPRHEGARMGDNEVRIDDRTMMLDEVLRLAAERHQGDDLLSDFLAEYYRELPGVDVDGRTAAEMYAVAVTHLGFGKHRPPGRTLLRVFTPDTERDGWSSDRSILLLVADDAPFLVDTVRMVLERHGVATHLMVHPMLRVERSADDDLIHVLDVDGSDDGTLEAWTQIEIDGCDEQRAAALQADLIASVGSIHAAVSSFEPMQERMLGHADLDPLLDWLAHRNFVFLGACTYRRSPDGIVTPDPDSLLGDAADTDPDDPPIDWDGPTVSVARSERESRIHRPARLTVVTVLLHDGDDVIADRFVGLLASSAYRDSVLSIPTVGDRARAVLGLAHFGAETHTGRSMRNVLETLPRDLAFELDADGLAHLVIDVVGLQERQIVRVFDVPEPVGDCVDGARVPPEASLPRAELPERVAAFVGAAYGDDPRDVESFFGCEQPRPGDVHRAAGPDRRPTSTIWPRSSTTRPRRGSSGCTTRPSTGSGEVAATELMVRIGEAAPDSYRTAVRPDTAVGDLRRLCRTPRRSVPRCRPRSCTRVDAEPGEWRMRVYRRGEPDCTVASCSRCSAISDSPCSTSTPTSSPSTAQHSTSTTSGCACPHGVDVDDLRHREVHAAFEGLLAGTIESDGFNRLVLLAGLTARQVNMLRVLLEVRAPDRLHVQPGLSSRTPSPGCPNSRQLLVELFEARFDPDIDDGRPACRGQRPSNPSCSRCSTGCRRSTTTASCGCSCALVQGDRAHHRLPRHARPLAIKFDPATGSRPARSRDRPTRSSCAQQRVEGVHLRGGPIARGGLRWSDRPEDYRTEVLGLVKAQMVKNAVIVPVGAKGGFVVQTAEDRRPRSNATEGVECYRMFVSGLLDLTDNLVDGRSRALRTVSVATTATIRTSWSPPTRAPPRSAIIANEIAAEYGFWLGDAFASGGSAGYDHKAMGITARGAWESVRRHASRARRGRRRR